MLDLFLSVGLGVAITWFLTHIYYKKQIQNTHELNSRLFEDYEELKKFMASLNSKLKMLLRVSSKGMSIEELEEEIETYRRELEKKVGERRQSEEEIRKITYGICPYCGKKSVKAHHPVGAAGYDIYCENCGTLGVAPSDEPPFYPELEKELVKSRDFEAKLGRR